MLKWNTVSSLLRNSLEKLMQASELADFRLVGGTALSLYLGHRISEDIDLFTDQPYGAVNFEAIEQFLENNFPYFNNSNHGLVSMGRAYFIGESEQDNLKLDVYYSMDNFMEDAFQLGNLRLATTGEITAMKIDVVQRGGRKKDFWDLHELMDQYSIEEMIDLHARRYHYTHDRNLIIRQFSNFDDADHDFDPICLKGKRWELIKYEIINVIRSLR